MMWRWRSTSNFTTRNVAYYNLYIHDRKWHFTSAKPTCLITLVTVRVTAWANAWMKVEGAMGDTRIYHLNVNEMCSARVLPQHI